MTPIVADLEQILAVIPVAEIPALIGVLAEFQAKAQLKLLSEQKVTKGGREALLTLRQVADRLSVPESRAYELARQGKLPAVRIGKYVRVSVEALAEYQAKLPKA
jgi:excisionase family DNA binding protein